MREDPDYEKLLLCLVTRFAEGQLDYQEFDRAFIRLLCDETPEDALTDAAVDFYGDINELLGWTGEDPSDADRAIGYRSPNELRLWLREALVELHAGRQPPRAFDEPKGQSKIDSP